MPALRSSRFNLPSDTTFLDHLEVLESESIQIIREAVASFSNPVMLYSCGKDSSVLLELATRAFAPGKLPFPLLHIDTGWKFKETYEFRDLTIRRHGLELIVHMNPDGLKQGIGPLSHGPELHTRVMKTQALRQALDKHGFDSALGGARRDEETSRAKERIYSLRDRSHRWNPENQRPEPWNLCNPLMSEDESMRIFPLSDWTELDIWLYIQRCRIPVAPLYFAARRPVIHRNGLLIVVDDGRLKLHVNEEPAEMLVRFRTLGCWPLTGAVASSASSIADIICELQDIRTSERAGRLTDNHGTIEQKKREGYF